MVDDQAEADMLLRESIKLAAPNLFWTQAHPLRNRANFHTMILPERTFYILQPKYLDPNVFTERMVVLGVAHVYFSVSLKFTSILFKTHYLGEKDGFLGFRFPQKIYTTQRRKDQRITIRDNYVVKAQFHMPTGKEWMKLYDISLGGISLDLDKAEAAKFKAGDVYDEVQFTLVERAINVNLQVRHVRANRINKNKMIVGLQFTKIDQDTLEFVGHYVEDEALYTNTLETINLFSE